MSRVDASGCRRFTESGLLTVEANGQMLGDVLAEIKKKSGIKFLLLRRAGRGQGGKRWP